VKRTKFRTQLAVHLVLAAGFAVLVGWLLARHVWPAATIWAVPTAGLITRILIMFRLRRMGWWSEDEAQRPSAALANRQTSWIFIVQSIGWLLAAGHLTAAGHWPLSTLMLLLAAMSIATTLFLRRPTLQQPATTATSSRPTSADE
jgi:uncharacterized membrane protein YfcA